MQKDFGRWYRWTSHKGRGVIITNMLESCHYQSIYWGGRRTPVVVIIDDCIASGAEPHIAGSFQMSRGRYDIARLQHISNCNDYSNW